MPKPHHQHDINYKNLFMDPDKERAEITQILTELTTLLPASEHQHLHRAFINWLGNTVFDRTEIRKDILHCTTIQEARSMLADIAPHWEQTFMEKGISIGETLGIKNILQEILTRRFGALPSEVMTSIEGISNTNDLKNLTHEAYRVNSFQAFCELLHRICN